MVRWRIGEIVLDCLCGLIKGPYNGKNVAGELEKEK